MDWSMVDEWTTQPYDAYFPYYEEKTTQPPEQIHAQAHLYPINQNFSLSPPPPNTMQPPPPPADVKGENPRELRNKAEKQRRDKMNQSIAQLAAIVPPILATGRKMNKTNVLKLTAHYLRSHQYVFGDSINQDRQFTASSTRALLGLLKGFMLTTTYKGVVVVVSQNVQQYLGYGELDLIGQNIFDVIHEEDRQLLRDQLLPRSDILGPNGELLIPDEPDGKQKLEEALTREKRSFVIRFKKFGQRSSPRQYLTCHVQGTLRRSDKACRKNNRCCQVVRRVRARNYNPCPSGNDLVFIGLVRPTSETFINERSLESFRMEYRTRHSIDGEIIECESRIALVTGYMTHEVNGVNAMNFMHKDDVRWVIVALREMYDHHRLVGESCYRLMTKSGQLIYMQTKGYLDVDQNSRAVTSFVCTNTVVEEPVGKHLIELMKKRYMLLINTGDNPALVQDEVNKDANDGHSLPVEDPRRLEKVILHLVTNLPSSPPVACQYNPVNGCSSPFRLSIIPPRKEKIVNAIEKIYSVIKSFKKKPKFGMEPTDGESHEEKKKDTTYRITTSDSEGESLGSLTSLSDSSGFESSSLIELSDLNINLRKRKSSFHNPTQTKVAKKDYSSLPSRTLREASSPEPGPSSVPPPVDPLLLQLLDSAHIADYAANNSGHAFSTAPLYNDRKRRKENITPLASNSSSDSSTDPNQAAYNLKNYAERCVELKRDYWLPCTHQPKHGHHRQYNLQRDDSNSDATCSCYYSTSFSDEETYSENSDKYYLVPIKPEPRTNETRSTPVTATVTSLTASQYSDSSYNNSSLENFTAPNTRYYKPIHSDPSLCCFVGRQGNPYGGNNNITTQMQQIPYDDIPAQFAGITTNTLGLDLLADILSLPVTESVFENSRIINNPQQFALSLPAIIEESPDQNQEEWQSQFIDTEDIIAAVLQSENVDGEGSTEHATLAEFPFPEVFEATEEGGETLNVKPVELETRTPDNEDEEVDVGVEGEVDVETTEEPQAVFEKMEVDE
ncbi:uncharacterized protein [Battus philenor]|uniref:uncharacterized protein n=1 Tax=Battus philenor TaxID=42288 RepID=UPI0035CFF8EB